MVKIERLGSRQLEECRHLIAEWLVIDNQTIRKEFAFKDFRTGLEFLNIIGDLAESLNHHPDIQLSYTKLTVQLSTHAIQALTELDIELARRIDNSYKKFKELKG